MNPFFTRIFFDFKSQKCLYLQVDLSYTKLVTA